jgi:hypothetical protein
MQPTQPPSNAPSQPHSANQSQPNPLPGLAAQPTFGTPYTLPSVQQTMDSKTPLSEGIQNSPWPSSYKLITLPKFNGKFDPLLFMSFKVVVASAGGNDTVLAKSFVIAAEGDASTYSMLRPSSVYSWEDLRDKIITNFKGITTESLMSMDLF